jgi:hypothetical protein
VNCNKHPHAPQLEYFSCSACYDEFRSRRSALRMTLREREIQLRELADCNLATDLKFEWMQELVGRCLQEYEVHEVDHLCAELTPYATYRSY